MAKFGIDAYEWNPVIFVFIAYSINISAFLSETIRSSILAVPSGQMEAGYAVGMSELDNAGHYCPAGFEDFIANVGEYVYWIVPGNSACIYGECN